MTRRSFFLTILLLMVSSVALAETSATQPKPLRLLFIGNSYTAFNGGLPKILMQMAKDAGRSLEVEGSLAGGKSLEWHWEEGKARAAIAKSKWDIVVLQDYSTQATSKPAKLAEYAKKFQDEIRKTGAKVVFYMTWARQHQPENQAIISKAYQTAADEGGAIVAPVGLAWQRALTDRKDLVLHFDDKSHPNPLGTYLTACVFYQVLLDEPPSDKVPTITNQRTKVVDEISPADAAYLRKVAREAVELSASHKPEPVAH